MPKDLLQHRAPDELHLLHNHPNPAQLRLKLQFLDVAGQVGPHPGLRRLLYRFLRHSVLHCIADDFCEVLSEESLM